MRIRPPQPPRGRWKYLLAVCAVLLSLGLAGTIRPVSTPVTGEATVKAATKEQLAYCRYLTQHDKGKARWRFDNGSNSCRIVCNSMEEHRNAADPYCFCKNGVGPRAPGDRSCACDKPPYNGHGFQKVNGHCRVKCNSKEKQKNSPDPWHMGIDRFCECKPGLERLPGAKDGDRRCQKECADWQAQERNRYTKWKRIDDQSNGGNLCRMDCKNGEVQIATDEDRGLKRHCGCPAGYQRPGTSPSAQRRCEQPPVPCKPGLERKAKKCVKIDKPTERQKLADEILRNKRIKFNVLVPKDDKEKTTPYWNLKFTSKGDAPLTTRNCQGRGDNVQAASNEDAEIDLKLLKFMRDLGKKTPYSINAITGLCHKGGSSHYSGKAVDIACPFESKLGLANRVGALYDVSKYPGEYCEQSHGNHYHFSIDGK